MRTINTPKATAAKSAIKPSIIPTTMQVLKPMITMPTTGTAAPAKTFTFTSPVPLRSDNWDGATVTPDHMYTLISGPDNKNIEEVLKDPGIPLLCITGTLYREIRYIVEKHPNSECAMFLTLKRLDANKPHFLAFDLFMPGQDVSGGSVSLDGPDSEKYFAALQDVPYYKTNGLHRHLCHLHSHGQLGVFWSGTDDKQQLSREDLGFMDDYRFYVVVNAKGELKCSFVTYRPVLQRIDAAVALSFSEPEHIAWLGRARKKELDTIMENTMHGLGMGATGNTWFGDAFEDHTAFEDPMWAGWPSLQGTKTRVPQAKPKTAAMHTGYAIDDIKTLNAILSGRIKTPDGSKHAAKIEKAYLQALSLDGMADHAKTELAAAKTLLGTLIGLLLRELGTDWEPPKSTAHILADYVDELLQGLGSGYSATLITEDILEFGRYRTMYSRQDAVELAQMVGENLAGIFTDENIVEGYVISMEI